METFQSANILAATESGIYYHSASLNNLSDPWEFRAFTAQNVPVLDIVDSHYPGEFAAFENQGVWHLFFCEDNFFSPGNDEIMPGSEPFNKEIRDIAAVYWRNGYFSCYVATDEGVYLIYFYEGDLVNVDVFDLKSLETIPGHKPLIFDQNIVAVDCFHRESVGDINDTTLVLVTTPLNVYEIKEVRDHNRNLVGDIEIREIVTGTYKSNIPSLSLPINASQAEQLITISDDGLIKKESANKSWNFIGKAFEDGEEGWIGTDIATDFSGEDDYILASSVLDQNGTIMRSENGGESWAESNPPDDPPISALYLEPITTISGYSAYAAGGTVSPWFSQNKGESWNQIGDLSGVSDIYSDPSDSRDAYVYACGVQAATVWASMYDGTSWTSLSNGISNLISLNEFAKGGDIPSLYLATYSGIYKANLNSGGIPWTPRTLGIETPNLGSIVSDKNDPYTFLVSTAPGVLPPRTWVTGDSGRSWNQLPPGEIPSEENDDCYINRLAASEDSHSGFVAGTNKGVFYLAPIVRRGPIIDDETWGPGLVLLNGDVTVQSGVTLTIVPGTDIKFTYNFDASSGGSSSNLTELIVNGTLVAGDENYPGDPVIFESSHPTTQAAGQWYGVKVENGGTIEMQYCQIKNATYGIKTSGSASLNLNHTLVDKCTSAGVYLSSSSASAEISDCQIQDCGSYGIYSNQGAFTASSDVIENAGYGIYYTGSGSPTVTDCQITATPGSQTYYGISISSSGGAPSPNISGNYIYGFAQRGINISAVSSSSTISNTEVYHCGVYGIYCSGSSPQILGGSDTKNWIKENTYGMWLTNSSSPTINRTKFDLNTYENLHISSGCWPVIHTASGYGNTFISQSVSPYYDLYNANKDEIDATGNYWGESVPIESQIRNAEYKPYLTNNPLPRIAPPSWQTANLPEDLFLARAYPNPFNPTTMISFNLLSSEEVTVKFYNIMGQRIRDLYSGYKEAGVISLVWDGKDMNGRPVSTGVYFCSIQTETKQQTIKLTMLK